DVVDVGMCLVLGEVVAYRDDDRGGQLGARPGIDAKPGGQLEAEEDRVVDAPQLVREERSQDEIEAALRRPPPPSFWRRGERRLAGIDPAVGRPAGPERHGRAWKAEAPFDGPQR